jgi:hypothetical protein
VESGGESDAGGKGIARRGCRGDGGDYGEEEGFPEAGGLVLYMQEIFRTIQFTQPLIPL